MKPSLQTQIAATESYLRILKDLDECGRLYKEAGIELPGILRQIINEGDENEEESEEPANKMEFGSIPPPHSPAQPKEAGDDWIHLPIKEATPTSLILAFLREHPGLVPVAEVLAYMKNVSHDAVTGSVYNALNRLAGTGVLTKEADGFALARKDDGGVIAGDYLWAPPDTLQQSEIAWHRRQAILHILQHQGPLQVVNLINWLNGSTWVKTRSNKDVLKLDMQALEEKGSAKRVEGTRRWEARHRG